MSKITVPLSATGTKLVCEDPDVRILSKTVGVYYIKLTLDAYWTYGEENILLVMKKKNENLSTVLEYSVGEVMSGADKEIPSALLETEGKISVWVGKTPSSGEQMLSGVLELTVEPSGGIIEEGDICVKTPLSENAVEKVRQVNGVFQYNASHEWKTLAGQNKVDEELAKKVDKAEGKGLSTNDYTDGDKQTVNDTLPHAIGVNSQAIAILNDKKVDKIEGKGLSTNDFTDEDKAEVAKVASKADISNPLSLPDNLLSTSGLLKHYYTPAGSTPGTGGTHNYSVSEIDQISLTEDIPKAVSKIPSSYAVAQYVQSSVSSKVDKVEGKGLSTNDYTNKDKDILDKLSKKFELIEQFTLTEDVTQIYRNQKPNGEAYNFNDVIMTLSIPIIEQGSTEAYGGTFIYIVNSETDIADYRVVAQGGVFKKGQVGNISVRAKIEGGIVFGSYGASAGNRSNKQAAFTSYSNMNMLSAENITSVLFTFFGQPIFSGTTIKIYAR